MFLLNLSLPLIRDGEMDFVGLNENTIRPFDSKVIKKL
jgi:hypothetical protein